MRLLLLCPLPPLPCTPPQLLLLGCWCELPIPRNPVQHCTPSLLPPTTQVDMSVGPEMLADGTAVALANPDPC